MEVFRYGSILQRGFLGGSGVKNPLASAGDARDVGLIPGWGRSPEEGNGNPLQYSCLDRKSHGQKNLVGYSPRDCGVRHD